MKQYRLVSIALLSAFCVIALSSSSCSQEEVPEDLRQWADKIFEEEEKAEEEFEEMLLSEEYVRLSWEASFNRDQEKLERLVDACVSAYQEEALAQQAPLKKLPSVSEAKKVEELNHVGTCLFIRAEYLMNSGKTKEAVASFQSIIKKYPFAQSWDPRGWYWSVKEKSQASIDILSGKAQEEIDNKPIKIIRTTPELYPICGAFHL